LCHHIAVFKSHDCPKHELLTLKQIHPAQGLLTSIVSVLTADSSGTKSMRLSRSSSCVGTQFDFGMQKCKGMHFAKRPKNIQFHCMQQLLPARVCSSFAQQQGVMWNLKVNMGFIAAVCGEEQQ